MTRAAIASISPFFIVRDVRRAVSFYREKLGFEVTFQEPGTPSDEPFFAIVCRDGGMIFLKGSGNAVPNATRHEWARWDAYVNVPDPDALAGEFAGCGVKFSEPLKDTHDGLCGFEVIDPDGYVLFFGRPKGEEHER